MSQTETRYPNQRTKAENPEEKTKPREHERQRQTVQKTKKVHKDWSSWTHKKRGRPGETVE